MFEGFTPETIDFLWGIRMNNNRDWFLEHKKQYVDTLYTPMKELGQLLFEPFLEKPGSILKVSRIYRDARLHHPLPYKESLWCCIRQDVDWWAENPCLFFEIRPEGVSYGYVPRQPVLTRADFRAAPGEIVALVGPSGGGKTTTIRLLLGLVRPQEGRAYLQAADGRQVEMNAGLRRYFSYVPQGNTLLSGTIADNLRMVKPDADDRQLREALEAACAWDFVSAMDGGLNASVGEHGHGLSEGQAQRIAIARALLRDAPVLLLDEATSALDVTTERTILRNLAARYPHKTCIVTTHRPTVISLCRRVYQVSGGRMELLDNDRAQRLAMDF